MDLMQKLEILSDAAKYDAACTSSGVDRGGQKGGIGNCVKAGLCHSFAADGRCISLLKVLMTNRCIYNCKYCVNRVTNDTPRTAFTPRELADLTIQFYRRNYIEGLFLSSGIQRSPNYTCEQMLETLELLRGEYRFGGYIHVKAIPGADQELIERLGLLADRMSVNIELPSQKSLTLLAPNKTKESILKPMDFISRGIQQGRELVKYTGAPRFVPAGQSTQMIIGATPDTDYQILRLTQGLYRKYGLKRVFFSAYMPVQEDSLLPSLDTKPPLLREHRLYQADWLMRYYGFDADELLSEERPNFNLFLDPKCDWALQHLERFPVEVNQADYETLLRVPGLGIRSVQRIIAARKTAYLDFCDLKKMGVVLKRAQYFITCRGKMLYPIPIDQDFIAGNLMGEEKRKEFQIGKKDSYRQLSLFDDMHLEAAGKEDVLYGDLHL